MTRPPLRPRLAAELLRAGRTVEVPLGGGSMRPLLVPGDLLRVRPARAADVQPGDVVLFEFEGDLVCHRLVHASGGRVLTRGDDSPDYDPPLPADAIIGRVDVPPSPHALYCAVRALLR
ncbi:MAG TPA: S24/S26 family peptidase [Polyangia bacterium]